MEGSFRLRLTLSLVALLLAAFAVANAADAPAATSDVALIGTIGGVSPFHMRLQIAQGKASGSYSRDEDKKDIPLKGSIGDDGSFLVQELEASGAVTAVFEGTRDASGRVVGMWTKQGAVVGVPFVADVDRTGSLPPGSPEAWIGVWTHVLSDQHDNSEVAISKATHESLEFALATHSGSHEAHIDGSARVEGAQARWEDPETGCWVTLSLCVDFINVVSGGACSSFQSPGAVVEDGEYRRGQSVRQVSLEEIGILEDEDQFVSLVGSDYSLFLKSFQLVKEEEDLDGLGATVFAGAVRGMFTLREGIVMSAPGGKLWAGIIHYDYYGTHTVRYYTNDPAWTGQLPKTFEKWRSRFTDMKVVFASQREGA